MAKSIFNNIIKVVIIRTALVVVESLAVAGRDSEGIPGRYSNGLLAQSSAHRRKRGDSVTLVVSGRTSQGVVVIR